MELNLENVIFIGRTYEEYMQMFGLAKEYIANKNILDCPWRSVLI
ncbi:MAG: hypothetical protein RL154_630 [Pseudomonadota bacterium]|jgi:hypothetical protein